MRVELSKFAPVLSSPIVYVADSLFEVATYTKLNAVFPTEVMKKMMGDRYFAEIDSERHQSCFEEIVASQLAWTRLTSAVSSRRFKKRLLSKFKADLLAVRGERAISRMVPRNTEIKCSFHLSRNGYLLSPHTDTGKKLITIVVYLGDLDTSLNGAGTRFYGARDPVRGKEFLLTLLDSKDKIQIEEPYGIVGVAIDRVYGSTDLSPEIEGKINHFDALHQVLLETSFVGNSAVLFIKSNNSWHDVRLSSLHDGQLRRSFVINFYLRESVTKRIVNRVTSSFVKRNR